MANFVLVHGAWGGAISWRTMAPLLREKGHEVFFTSLTGLGERYHLGGPETNLSTHIHSAPTESWPRAPATRLDPVSRARST
jgi:hypothetical protein